MHTLELKQVNVLPSKDQAKTGESSKADWAIVVSSIIYHNAKI